MKVGGLPIVRGFIVSLRSCLLRQEKSRDLLRTVAFIPGALYERINIYCCVLQRLVVDVHHVVHMLAKRRGCWDGKVKYVLDMAFGQNELIKVI